MLREWGEGPLEVVKWAKDLWKLKETMKTLKDKGGKVLETDKEKVEGIVRDTFEWDSTGRQL